MEMTVIPHDDEISHIRLSGRMDPHGTQQIKGESLVDHAIELVLAGKTTIDEVMRISEQFED